MCGDKSAPLDYFDATFTVMSHCSAWKVADTTRALIPDATDSRGSAPFHLDHCMPRRGSEGGWPTWVPDWQDIGKYGMEPWPVNDFDAAPGMLPTPSSQCGDLAVLCRLGCYFDKITGVMPPPR